jgi:hypothetical protein
MCGTGKEIDILNIESDVNSKILKAKIYSGMESLEYVKECADSRSIEVAEGFVIHDKNLNRMKIKSEGYQLAHRCLTSLVTFKARLELVLSDSFDDIYPALPYVDKVDVDHVEGKLNTFISFVKFIYGLCKDVESQKEFALAVKNYSCSAILFNMRKGIPISESIKKMSIDNVAKMVEDPEPWRQRGNK